MTHMIRKRVCQIFSFICICCRVFAVVVSVMLLSSCVTERTGGFQVKEDEAIQDYLQLSREYLEVGDLAKARFHLNNVKNLDSDNAQMFGIHALIYAEEGDLELADESFRKSLRLDSNDSRTRNNYAAFLFANERFEDAYENLEQVVQDTDYSGRPLAFENLGLTALRLGRPEDAKQAFMRAVQLNRNQLRSLTELTDMSIEEGDYEAAQDYYNSILTVAQAYAQVQLTPHHLLQGIKLARVTGDEDKITLYSRQLGTSFPNSVEYQIYQQSLLNE